MRSFARTIGHCHSARTLSRITLFGNRPFTAGRIQLHLQAHLGQVRILQRRHGLQIHDGSLHCLIPHAHVAHTPQSPLPDHGARIINLAAHKLAEILDVGGRPKVSQEKILPE